jgi:hypothetical protein
MFMVLVHHAAPLCLQWPLTELFLAGWASSIG